MRRLVGVLALLTLIAATMSPALAKGKAVKTTLYMHGVYQLGELDGADWIANSTPPMQMTAAEPDGQAPRSMFTGNPALNKQCTGLPTGFPTWEAIGVAGKIVGDAKLTMNFVSPPANVTARLWVDTPMFSCNEAYVEPTVEVLVPVPAGQNAVEIVFPKLNIAAKYNMIVEILGTGGGQAGRVLYDSPDAASALEFTCIPASGKACI
jgi:hypothetical protein